MKDPSAIPLDELEAAIRYHNHKYWVEDAPEISDYDFDRLVEALRQRKPDSPLLDAIGAEGALVEAARGEEVKVVTELDFDHLELGDKVEHTRPMLSLEKCYGIEDLLWWWDKFEGDAVASPKVDGVAAALRYDAKGRLALGITRGSGRVGEVVTVNIRQVEGVPEKIPAGPAEVRGEVYMPLSVFRSQYAGLFANPRNLTAGALKQKELGRTAAYRVRFLAYDLDAPPGVALETEIEKRNLLGTYGFTPVEQTLATKESAEAVYQDLLARRDAFDYETDGVVFKANFLKEHNRLGLTAHHPRYAIAYKFQGESGVSRLEAVEWSVSRTGAINPVAVVAPVELSGVTVTRASLHNLSIIEKLGGSEGLKIGARVLMMRRGGVIPHVEQMLEPGTEPFETPATCPSCGGPTMRRDDILVAEHTPSCPATMLGELAHYARVVDAKGFGPKLLTQLIEADLLAEPADLYKLKVPTLVQLERVGPKLAEKLVAEMDERRQLPLPTFLCALGIDDLGPVVARTIASAVGGLGELVRATDEDPQVWRARLMERLTSIKGVGSVIAQSVAKGLEQREVVIAHLLEEVTLTGTPAAAPATEGPLTGQKVLFTGELQSMSRKAAQELVRSLGGETPDSVAKDLTQLVLGDADLERFQKGWRSSKLKKVEALNEKGAAIEIIGETVFLKRVGQA